MDYRRYEPTHLNIRSSSRSNQKIGFTKPLRLISLLQSFQTKLFMHWVYQSDKTLDQAELPWQKKAEKSMTEIVLTWPHSLQNSLKVGLSLQTIKLLSKILYLKLNDYAIFFRFHHRGNTSLANDSAKRIRDKADKTVNFFSSSKFKSFHWGFTAEYMQNFFRNFYVLHY